MEGGFSRCGRLDAEGVGVHGGAHHGAYALAGVEPFGGLRPIRVGLALQDMVGHALHPAIEQTAHLPPILLHNVVEERLRPRRVAQEHFTGRGVGEPAAPHVVHRLLITVEVDGDEQREHHVEEVFIDVVEVLGHQLPQQLWSRPFAIPLPAGVHKPGEEPLEEAPHHGGSHLALGYLSCHFFCLSNLRRKPVATG